MALCAGLVAALKQDCSYMHILNIRQLFVLCPQPSLQKFVEDGGIVLLNLFASLVAGLAAALEAGLCIHISYIIYVSR